MSKIPKIQVSLLFVSIALTVLTLVGCKAISNRTAFDAHYIRTNGYYENAEYPAIKIIRSVDELNIYYVENKDTYYLGHSLSATTNEKTGFIDICERYDDNYFKNRILIMVLLEEGSGSIRHKVTEVRLTDSKFIIEIESITPEIGTCDMAEWHILIEPEAGIDILSETDVDLFIDGKYISYKESIN